MIEFTVWPRWYCCSWWYDGGYGIKYDFFDWVQKYCVFLKFCYSSTFWEFDPFEMLNTFEMLALKSQRKSWKSQRLSPSFAQFCLINSKISLPYWNEILDSFIAEQNYASATIFLNHHSHFLMGQIETNIRQKRAESVDWLIDELSNLTFLFFFSFSVFLSVKSRIEFSYQLSTTIIFPLYRIKLA